MLYRTHHNEKADLIKKPPVSRYEDWSVRTTAIIILWHALRNDALGLGAPAPTSSSPIGQFAAPVSPLGAPPFIRHKAQQDTEAQLNKARGRRNVVYVAIFISFVRDLFWSKQRSSSKFVLVIFNRNAIIPLTSFHLSPSKNMETSWFTRSRVHGYFGSILVY